MKRRTRSTFVPQMAYRRWWLSCDCVTVRLYARPWIRSVQRAPRVTFE